MELALRLGATACAFVSLLAAAEWVARRYSLAAEHGRKLAHVVGGIMSASLPAILSFPAIAALSGAFIPFMLATRRLGVFPLIHSAERSSYGEVYFPLGVMVAAIAVPHAVQFAFGVLVMAIADASASVVGRRFGKRSYRLTAQKTYLGSATFFATTVILGVVAAQVLGKFSGLALVSILAISLLMTAEEAAIGGGADNVTLPVSAAALIHVLL